MNEESKKELLKELAAIMREEAQVEALENEE